MQQLAVTTAGRRGGETPRGLPSRSSAQLRWKKRAPDRAASGAIGEWPGFDQPAAGRIPRQAHARTYLAIRRPPARTHAPTGEPNIHVLVRPSAALGAVVCLSAAEQSDLRKMNIVLAVQTVWGTATLFCRAEQTLFCLFCLF
jgi:hypothetical protein